MYLDYWQFATKPFEPNPHSGAGDEFVYPCESHDGALSKLRYAAQEGRCAAALAGPSGVGKTLLIRRLVSTLDTEKTPLIHLVFPQMSGKDLLAYLAERLNAPTFDAPTGTIEESVRRLEALAKQNAERGIHPLIVIDEAHLLEDTGALETLRLLMNFGGDQSAFTLLLVGQMGLLSSIARSPAFDERLAVKTLVRSFTATETTEYVHHRLSAAGASRAIFDDNALQQLHTLTGGVARQINRLADLALVVGFAARVPHISVDELTSVHRELVSVGSD